MSTEDFRQGRASSDAAPQDKQPVAPPDTVSAKHYKMLADAMHNNLVGMQSAWIEWRHGKGAEAAMRWIHNALAGPGLIPSEEAEYGTEPQAWYDANCADPLPRCYCGRPSNIATMKQGFCSEAHYQHAKAQGALDSSASGSPASQGKSQQGDPMTSPKHSHSVHLAVNDAGQDVRDGSAQSTSAPSAHTPGPWILATSNSWRRFLSAEGCSVCEPVKQNDGHPDLYFRNGGADGPDARLILAAPEMAAVLAEFIKARNESSDVLDFCERVDTFIEEAELILATATGAQA